MHHDRTGVALLIERPGFFGSYSSVKARYTWFPDDRGGKSGMPAELWNNLVGTEGVEVASAER